MGLFVIFSMFSYRFFWDHIIHDELFRKSDFISDKLLWIGLVFIAIGAFIFIRKKFKDAFADIQPDVAAIIIYIVAFFVLGKFAPLAGMILTNLMMLLLGIYYLQKGVKTQSLLWLNYGLLWLFLLLIYRFSDVNQGYLARGLFFIGLGILLFFINIFVVGKKGKEQKNVG
jgi:LPXTG-motif cell wall-anchored protein